MTIRELPDFSLLVTLIISEKEREGSLLPILHVSTLEVRCATAMPCLLNANP
jgi:hypothetical protein